MTATEFRPGLEERRGETEDPPAPPPAEPMPGEEPLPIEEPDQPDQEEGDDGDADDS